MSPVRTSSYFHSQIHRLLRIQSQVEDFEAVLRKGLSIAHASLVLRCRCQQVTQSQVAFVFET